MPITEAISLALARASFHHEGPEPGGGPLVGGWEPIGGGNVVFGGGNEMLGNDDGGGTVTLVADGGGPKRCIGG